MLTIKMFPLAAALLAATSFSVNAQDWKTAIEKKLVSEYTLTTPTAANDDIVTAGSVLVLKTGRIMMPPVSNANANVFQNTYKDGKLNQGFAGKANRFGGLTSHIPGASSVPSTGDQRTFVAGEKMWVTGIGVKEDSIVFSLFTDAYSDVRYHSQLTFKLPKGLTLTPEQADTLVGQVFGIQPPDDDKKSDAKGGVPAPVTPAAPNNPAPEPAAVTPPPPAAPAETQAVVPPPPPPPPADPKSISKGQTVDEVVANFGQPKKMVKLGTKQIYVYDDLKVTFINGKVTDVE